MPPASPRKYLDVKISRSRPGWKDDGMTDPRRPVTVVTGASAGIGAAVAVRLARQGHDLVLGYRRSGDGARAVADRCKELGARAVTVGGDVADDADVARLFAAAAELGPLTGLVANAGMTAHLGDLADTPVDVVRRVVGVLLCLRRAAQVMSTARGGAGGAIVTVSSSSTTSGSAHEYVHYAAAKAGVEVATLGLARELAREGVRVNCVAPGLVDTGIHADAGDASRPARMAPQIPLGRAGEPDEIAAAVVWLLGPEASYTTGSTLRVTGGR
jgi:NAD(P)-dependent dehydrogenase (short-subunit alcohol dehydrogenase family)